MPNKSPTVDQILTLLSEGPLRIAAVTAHLAPAQLQAAPRPGEWSANDVLAHLRSCADVWGDCIQTILNHHTPTIRAVNPRTWIKSTNYLELEFPRSLEAFAVQRTRLLQVLRLLTPESWSRSATVTGAGKPLKRTIRSYAEWMATHERPHIKQIERITRSMRR